MCISFVLFVIFCALKNTEATVQGFQKQYPHHLVREGQLGDRQAQIAGSFDIGGEAVGGADDQAQAAVFQEGAF